MKYPVSGRNGQITFPIRLSLLGRNRLTCLGLVVLAVSLLLRAPASAAGTRPAEDFHKTIEPILSHYCYDCHGNGEHKGDMTLDNFKGNSPLPGTPELWWKVLKNVRAGIMPPQGNDRPTDDEKVRLADWIKYGSFGVDPASPDPGRVTIRRLNRTEYRRTIQDLMGVDFNTTEEFPSDDTGYGFDTIGDALSLSPLLLENYMQAAQAIVGQAVPLTAKKPAETFFGSNALHSADHSYDASYLSFDKEISVSANFTAQKAGSYVLHVNLSVDGDFNFDAGKCNAVLKVGDKEEWTQELAWAEGKKLNINLPETWQPQDYPLHFEMHPIPLPDGKQTKSHVRITSVRIEGPMDPKDWVATDNYHRFFPKVEAPKADPERGKYAREVLANFTRKAFRRPADSHTLDRLVQIAQGVYRQPGKTFEQGISQAMVAVLASPRFLFRVEQSASQHPGESFSPIDEYSLASRLSYFLWSSMPDDELSELADRGELRTNLDAQFTRMLKDPRSEALVKNFAGQWLQLRDVESVPINGGVIQARDSVAAPDGNNDQPRQPRGGKIKLDSQLRQAIREEPERLFARILHENRILSELIDCDYTFLNAPLAKLYNMPGVDSDRMHLVQLPPDSPRGGILTMSAFLMVTSNPTRTSPVKRGQFILDNILGMPTPPPPPNIPALEESLNGFKDHEPSFREVLELHRRKPLCSSCHSRMDPLGLSLENFNAMGMWRDKEKGLPIDAAGKLTTGETFHDIRDLKKIVKNNHLHEFYRCVAEKMLTYALGRGLEYYDVESVDRIVDQIERENGQASALVSGILKSVPFQERRNFLAADPTIPGPSVRASN